MRCFVRKKKNTKRHIFVFVMIQTFPAIPLYAADDDRFTHFTHTYPVKKKDGINNTWERWKPYGYS